MTVRTAARADRHAILSLTRNEEHVHAHLDWRPIDDWLGTQPFLLAVNGRHVVGALACPPDPPDTAWLRLFVATRSVSLRRTWDRLWQQARAALSAQGVQTAAALSIEAWVGELCAAAGFEATDMVQVLARDLGAAPPPEAAPAATVRPASPADFPAIAATDLAAFAPPWQMSESVILDAINRAGLLSVAEADGQVVGYQLSTPSPQGSHLARLAVLPAWQGRGIGAALVRHLIDQATRRGARALTVNTQRSNITSLRLYRRLGFVPTGEQYPVYTLRLA